MLNIEWGTDFLLLLSALYYNINENFIHHVRELYELPKPTVTLRIEDRETFSMSSLDLELKNLLEKSLTDPSQEVTAVHERVNYPSSHSGQKIGMKPTSGHFLRKKAWRRQ